MIQCGRTTATEPALVVTTAGRGDAVGAVGTVGTSIDEAAVGAAAAAGVVACRDGAPDAETAIENEFSGDGRSPVSEPRAS